MYNVLSTGNNIVGPVNQPLTLSNIIFINIPDGINSPSVLDNLIYNNKIISVFKESFLKEDFGCIVLKG